jgi:hypothetical protein
MIAPNEVDDIDVYLDEGELFPMWYKGPKDKITLKSSKRKKGTSRYDCENILIGEDDNYKYYLNEAGLTDGELEICPFENFVREGQFKVILVCKMEPKTPHAIRYHLNGIILSYNVLYVPN